jgi:sugar lactone lactonase YvrE
MLRRHAIVAAATALACVVAAASAAEPPGTEIAWTMSSLPGGGQPFEILAADFDADGSLDLAVTNSTASTIGIYRGNGDGTFAAPETFPTGEGPRGLVAADFNRDGIVDLAAAGSQDGGLTVHLGQGGGRFAPGRHLITGERPFHAVTADFNADGIPDIALANEDRFVSILLGDGHGGFAGRKFDTDKWPSNVVAADFDEDGHLDFASTNWGSNNVTVLFGRGDGTTFSAPKPFTYEQDEGHGLFGIIAPDLDRDGHADMVWNDLQNSGWYVLYGDGHGDFPRTRLVPAADGVRSVRAVDLNGDGWLDLVSADSGAGDVSVALADGHGDFQPTQHVPAGVKPRVVTAGDFNRDGRPDLAVTNMETNSITVMLNRGSVPRSAEPFDPGPQDTKRVIEYDGLSIPGAILVAPTGDLIVSDQLHGRVVRIAPADGRLTVLAGTGQSADRGDGEPAVEASLRQPAGLALDAGGTLYVADFDSQRIRKVDPSGVISAVAGTGKAGFAGDGGPAGLAKFAKPHSLAVDGSGALYVGDLMNLRIRRIDPSGTITTVAGNGTSGYSGDGGPASAASLGLFARVASARDGTLYIADQLNRAVRKVDHSGTISTVAGGKRAGQDGDIGQPTAVTVGPDETVYFASGVRIAKLTPSGSVETVATLPGQNPADQLMLLGLAVDRSGAIYAVDSRNRVLRVDRGGGPPQVVFGGADATATPGNPGTAGKP